MEGNGNGKEAKIWIDSSTENHSAYCHYSILLGHVIRRIYRDDCFKKRKKNGTTGIQWNISLGTYHVSHFIGWIPSRFPSKRSNSYFKWIHSRRSITTVYDASVSKCDI